MESSNNAPHINKSVYLGSENMKIQSYQQPMNIPYLTHFSLVEFPLFEKISCQYLHS